MGVPKPLLRPQNSPICLVILGYITKGMVMEITHRCGKARSLPFRDLG
jgi:hypothetical protein